MTLVLSNLLQFCSYVSNLDIGHTYDEHLVLVLKSGVTAASSRRNQDSTDKIHQSDRHGYLPKAQK
jgi:hypothetical protein